MRRTSFKGANCSVAATLEIVGEWWSLLLVRAVFLGFTRFDDLQERLGIARNILTARLRKLVDHGVLERVRYMHALWHVFVLALLQVVNTKFIPLIYFKF